MFSFISLKSQETKDCYASFYHHSFNGKKTASGHHFDNKNYTCAHRSLPFGTKIEIVNLENGNYVVATVTDRGPYAKSRCLDVTKQIAEDLDFVKQGVAKIQYRVLEEDPLWYVIKSSDSALFENRYGIKIGKFINYAEAALVAKKVSACCGGMVNLGRTSNTEKSFLLIVGNCTSQTEANELLQSFPIDPSKLEVYSYDKIFNALK